MEEKIIEITLSPAKLLQLYIKGHGISYAWIARNLDYTPTYIAGMCNENLPLSKKTREKINELLETNY